MRAVLISSIAAAVAAGLFLFILLRSGLAWRIAVDEPNRRSLHLRTVPRVGGLVVVGIALMATSIVAPTLQILTVAAACLMVMSAIDDRRGLKVFRRGYLFNLSLLRSRRSL